MITTKDIIRLKLREYDKYMDEARSQMKKAELVLDSVKRMCDREDKPKEEPIKVLVATWVSPSICKKGGTEHLAYYVSTGKFLCDDPSCHRTQCQFFWRRKCDECLGTK